MSSASEDDDLKEKRSPVFLKEKVRVTPSVTAPGDINRSDATAYFLSHLYRYVVLRHRQGMSTSYIVHSVARA